MKYNSLVQTHPLQVLKSSLIHSVPLWNLLRGAILMLGIALTATAAETNSSSSAVAAGLQWLIDHPAGPSNGGLLEQGEEVIAFNYLQANTKRNLADIIRDKAARFLKHSEEMKTMILSDTNDWCLPTYLAVRFIRPDVKDQLDLNLLRESSERYSRSRERTLYVIWNLKYLELMGAVRANDTDYL